MKILLGIEGGIGKNIAATGAVKVAKEKGHEIHVITAWPQVWEGNPNVAKIYEWEKAEYFSDKIKEFEHVILQDPYRHSEFLLSGCDITCVYNLMINGLCQPVKPQIFLNKAEYMYVDELLKDVEKPIFVVQTNGGGGEGYAWNRDIPLEEAVEMLNPFAEKYEIIHLRADNQLEIGGTKHIAELNIRQAIIVLSKSEKRLLIDSVYQHAAAALDLPSVVLWVQTEIEKFGYEMHTNIECNEPALKNMDRLEGLFSGLDGDISKCPFGKDQKIFDVKKVVAALEQCETK